MSRIGRLAIPIPDGVSVEACPGHVVVKGPKGELERTVPEEIEVAVEGDVAVCRRLSDARRARALHGLVRALVNNMVIGVSQGFTRRLLLQGIGYRVTVTEGVLMITAGHSHPVEVDVPQGLELRTEPVSTNPPVSRLIIAGTNKEQVGQFAADIRSLRPVEPYKMKGFRYEDEIVRKKAGKAAVGGR